MRTAALVALVAVGGSVCGIPALALSARASVQAGTASIRGLAIDDQGSPVPGVRVSALLNPGEPQAGPLRTCVTDSAGHFDFGQVPSGLYELSSEKTEAGFPDSSIAAFQEERSDAVTVEVKEGVDVDAVVLRMGTPLGVLRASIVDGATGLPVLAARVEITRADVAGAFVSMGVDSTGVIVLACPNKPLIIEVKAAGYKPWHLRSSQEGEVALPPHGTTKSVTIRLQSVH